MHMQILNNRLAAAYCGFSCIIDQKIKGERDY